MIDVTSAINPPQEEIDPACIQIPMRAGGTLIIDPVDADLLAYNWNSICPSPNTGARYARAHHKHGKRSYEQLYLHRVIGGRMVGHDLTRSEYVDHFNKNGLDCRRVNLRPCTPSQNQGNKRKPRKADGEYTSKYKGVFWYKTTRKWRATLAGKHLGTFSTEENAHAAYCVAAKHLFGEFFDDGTSVSPEIEPVKSPPRRQNGSLAGTQWYKANQKWAAVIQKKGIKKHIGMFATEQEAHEAYLKALEAQS